MGKSENIRRAERKEEEARSLLREAAYLRDLQKRLDVAADDDAGMAWWNGLTEQERTKWAAVANTGRAKDAWEAFKRAGQSA
jgi:hypothetical protein